MPDRDLGQALTNDYQTGAGTARLHERGLVVRAPGVALTGWFNLPPVARPSILSGEPASRPVFSIDVEAEGDGWTVAELPGLVDTALASRIGLMPLGGGDVAAVSVGAAEGGAAGSVRLPVFASTVAERVLHDVTVRVDSGAAVPIAPHAVYYRRSWSDFGLAHITDMHVARRIDRFRGLLHEARRPAAAEAIVNWNDRFRGFVKYANYLHRIGVLDVIIATGDLFDYLHEDDDDPDGGGNALFLRQLVLGQVPGPDFGDVEPLVAPIFMVPGNHDYRRHAYRLIFDVHVGLAGIGVDIHRFDNYSGYGLNQTDATALANRLDPNWLGDVSGHPELGDRSVPEVSPDGAARMVAIDPSIGAYHRFLNDTGTYVVELGEHRILMVDSGPDIGVVNSIPEALAEYLGLLGEDEATFVGGSPNCKGPTSADVDLLAGLLNDAPDGALVMVATHAPYVNFWHTEYPYFLRESQRRHHGELVEGHLDAMAPRPMDMSSPQEMHPSWWGPHGSPDVDFVKRGDNDDLLDYGVSRGETGRLLRTISGLEARRPADLVLAGHTHRDNEVVIRRTPDGASAFFFDFYTANPGNWYPTSFQTGDGRQKAWVSVVPGAAADLRPTRVFDADYEFEVSVPSHSDTLAETSDPAAWWSTHRPLLLQTAALGPLSGLRDFAGFRLIEVADNVVRQVARVPIDRLDEHGYDLDWNSARSPLPPRRVPSPPWRRVSEGSTAPAGRVTALPLGLDEVMLVVADAAGGVYFSRGRKTKWGPWSSVSEGSTVPGGVVTAVAHRSEVQLFLADVAGGVYTARSDGSSWGPWSNVSEGSTLPGATVSAVVHGEDIQLFLADPGGGVYTNRGSGSSWSGWSNVSEGSTVPGGTVSAVVHDGDIQLFLADPGGGVYTNRGSGSSWSGWSNVSEGSTVPGGTVSAVVHDGDIQLFLADPGGGVYTNRGSGSSWSGWSNVSEGSTVPGGVITPVVHEGKIHVFLADAAGGVYGTHGAQSTWDAWTNLAEGVTAPGAAIAAASRFELPASIYLVLALADPSGGVYAKIIRS